jgi:hypothetical protein
MSGVLQMQKDVEARLPAGSVAKVTIRVVGRNTKGPLATIELPLEGKTFPIEFTISRADLREGVPDYIWVEDDIYVKGDVVSSSGSGYAEGRSKAKAGKADGVAIHQTAYLTLE